MRLGKEYIGILSLLLFAIGCGPSISEEKLNQIGELETILDSSEARVLSIDTALAKQLADTFELKLYFFQYKLKDTLPREEATFIDTWYGMRKTVRKYSRNVDLILNEINISKKQMQDLRFDAENGLLDEKQFDDYISLERNNVEKVGYAADDLMNRFEKVYPLIQKKLPRVDSLIKAYREKEIQKE